MSPALSNSLLVGIKTSEESQIAAKIELKFVFCDAERKS